MKDGDRFLAELRLKEQERLQEMADRCFSKLRLICYTNYELGRVPYPDQPVEDQGIRN